MSSELEKSKTTQMLDNFADFDTSVEGDDDRTLGGGMLVGTRLKFGNDAKWRTHPDGDDCSGRVLVASNIRRLEIKWGLVPNSPPIDHRELKSGEKFRNMKELNEACPKEEWRESFGKMVGPWQIQHVLELCDLSSMEKFSWPTSTIGGSVAIEQLVDRILMKRQFFKRVDIWPLVRLSNRFMRTKWQGRERPHLEIIEWYWPNKGESDKIEAAPTQPKSLPPALAKAPEVSPSEEMDDNLPY
jgi:hypothetical protein